MEEKSPTIRINWQRLPLAITGLVGVIGVPVTMILAAFSVVGWSAPLLLAFLAMASVGGLRLLVLRDQYKPNGYRQTPTAASYQRKVVPGLAPRSTTAEPFDRAENTPESVGAADTIAHAEDTAVQTAEEKPSEPLTEQMALAELRESAPAEEENNTWEPVDVPAPTYTREAKVERLEPAPLEMPEQPRASINRLKDTLPAEDNSLREEQERMIRTSVRAHQPKAGALNLDDVLERRRA